MSRPTIGQLEKMLNDPGRDNRSIEIKPNGDVVELSATELLEKNLRLSQEVNEALRDEVKKLKAALREIVRICGSE